MRSFEVVSKVPSEISHDRFVGAIMVESTAGPLHCLMPPQTDG